MKPRTRNTLWKKPTTVNEYECNVDALILPDPLPPRKRGRKRHKRGKPPLNNAKTAKNPSASKPENLVKKDTRGIRNDLHFILHGCKKYTDYTKENNKKPKKNESNNDEKSGKECQEDSKINRSHLHREVKNKKNVADIYEFYQFEDDYFETENKPKNLKKIKTDVLNSKNKQQNTNNKEKTKKNIKAKKFEPVAGPSKETETVFQEDISDLLNRKRVEDISKKELKKILKTINSWRSKTNDRDTNEFRSEPKNSPFYPKNPNCKIDASFSIKFNNLENEEMTSSNPEMFFREKNVILNIDENVLKNIVDNCFDEEILKINELRICDENEEEYEELKESSKLILRKSIIKEQITINLLEDSMKALESKIEAANHILEWCLRDKNNKKRPKS